MQYAEISPFGQYVFTEPENLWYNITVAGLLIFIGSALSVKHLLYRPVQILYITYPRREERLEFMVIYPITERTAKLREAAVANQYSPEIFAQRDYWFYRGVLSCEESAGRMECISAGLCSVLENIRPLIFEGERIVGYNFADGNMEETWQDEDTLRRLQPFSMLTEAEMEWFITNRGRPFSRQEMLERVSRFGCQVYRTDQQGTIIFRR